MKKQSIGIGIMLLLLVSLTRFTKIKSNEIVIEPLITENFETELEVSSDEIDFMETRLIVDIKGEVNYPGIYEVDESYRVHDVVLLAGGLTQFAQTNSVNFAQKVRDEMVIYIPNQNEEINGILEEDKTNITQNSKVSINKGSLAELQTLPGIGSVKAQAIISYREEIGLFAQIEELINVNGIGSKTLENLRDFIEL